MSIHVGGYFVVLLLIGVATLSDFQMCYPARFCSHFSNQGRYPIRFRCFLDQGRDPNAVRSILGATRHLL